MLSLTLFPSSLTLFPPAANPVSLRSPVLTSICNAALKCCELINYIVSTSGCYEEEDFSTCTYGYNIAPGLSTSKIINMVKDCEEVINKKTKCGAEVSAGETALLHRLNFW